MTIKLSEPLRINHAFSVAPMMDWTDRHCRFFYRQFTRQTVLYTEMVTAQALVRGGNPDKMLVFDPCEKPLVLQLGGSCTDLLQQAVKIAGDYPYDEINLNVGCPSDRVQSGLFGACLMKHPGKVADCLLAMQSVANCPITVKCRLGVDNDDPYQTLPEFIQILHDAGCRRVILHARKAWLKGLSPAQNRQVPPLDYNLVRQIKAAFPQLSIIINGGIQDAEQGINFLPQLDGVMMGRAIYHQPDQLWQVDRLYYGNQSSISNIEDLCAAMVFYIDHMATKGIAARQITRHMLGLFRGQKGARHWRRLLGESGDLRKAVAALKEV